MLEKVAFEVDEAEDGEEGLQILKQKKFNVILLDIHMPKLDGEQVMSILNKRKESLPVIVVSAYLRKNELSNLHNLV